MSAQEGMKYAMQGDIFSNAPEGARKMMLGAIEDARKALTAGELRGLIVIPIYRDERHGVGVLCGPSETLVGQLEKSKFQIIFQELQAAAEEQRRMVLLAMAQAGQA